MSQDPKEQQLQKPPESAEDERCLNTSHRFAMEVVPGKSGVSMALVGMLKEVLSQPRILDLCINLLGQRACKVVVERRSSAREPEVSFNTPGQIGIGLPAKFSATESDKKHLERSILTAGFIALACNAAEYAVRRGGIPQEQAELLRATAIGCTEAEGCATHLGSSEQPAAPRHIVRDLLSRLLDEPRTKAGSKNAKLMRNPYRQELQESLKKLLSQLGGRIDCSTPEKAERALSATMQGVAGVKALTELLDDTSTSGKVVSGAVERLLTGLREQFARNLIACDHERCDTFLQIFRALHAELAGGGYHRPLPALLRAAPPATSTGSSLSLREILSGDLLGASLRLPLAAPGSSNSSGGQLADALQVPKATTIAREILELAEVLSLNRELHFELEASQRDIFDFVSTLAALAPRLAQTLIQFRSGDDSADPTVFEDLLVASLAMRLDPSGHGIWYHDALLAGREIPPLERRNPETNAHERANVYLEAMQILRAWRDPTVCSRADLIEDKSRFFNLFVTSSARVAILGYEGGCSVALSEGGSHLVEGAEIVLDDLAALEANIPFIREFLPTTSMRQLADTMLRDAIRGVREALKKLTQTEMSDEVLVRSVQQGPVAESFSGPLKESLQAANQKLQQRIAQYAETLTQGAQEQLEDLFSQGSARGLIEHSVKLLDVVRLAPTEPSNIVLTQMIEEKIRGYINLIDEAYGEPINRVARMAQTSSVRGSTDGLLDEENRKVLTAADIQGALQSVAFMVKELRLMREGVSSYRDLLVPAQNQSGDSAAIISRASVVELSSLIAEQMTGKLSRVLKAQPELARSVYRQLKEDAANAEPGQRQEAGLALEGLELLRLPRGVLAESPHDAERTMTQ